MAMKLLLQGHRSGLAPYSVWTEIPIEMHTLVHSAHAHDVTIAHQVLDAVTALLILSGSSGEERVLPAFHFFRRYIFYVRGDAPLLAERVGNLSVAVAPEHILQWHIDSR